MWLFFLDYYDTSTFNSQCKGASVSMSQSSTGEISGTFCPSSTIYYVDFEGYGDKVEYWIRKNDGTDFYGKIDHTCFLCTCGDVDETFYQTFYHNRCYPYRLKISDHCNGETDKIGIYHGGLVSPTYSCSGYDDCKPLYYGSTCEGPVPSFDSTNCPVSLGRSGNGKCTNCLSATNVQAHCRPGTTGLKAQYYWKEKNTDTSWTFKNELSQVIFEPSDDYYYSQYKISGYIVIPSTSYSYSFYLTSQTPATLKVDSKTGGTLNYLDCSPNDSHNVEITGITVSEIKAVYFEINIDTGCSLNQVKANLKWKYNNNGYSDIPAKYIFH